MRDCTKSMKDYSVGGGTLQRVRLKHKDGNLNEKLLRYWFRAHNAAHVRLTTQRISARLEYRYLEQICVQVVNEDDRTHAQGLRQ